MKETVEEAGLNVKEGVVDTLCSFAFSCCSTLFITLENASNSFLRVWSPPNPTRLVVGVVVLMGGVLLDRLELPVMGGDLRVGVTRGGSSTSSKGTRRGIPHIFPFIISSAVKERSESLLEQVGVV